MLLLTIHRFEHAETHDQLRENHNEILVRLARLDREIERGNARLRSSSSESPGTRQTLGASGDVENNHEELDDAESYDGLQILKECISTAETVRDNFESAYDPDGISLVRFADDFEHQVSDEELYGQSDLDDTEPEKLINHHDSGVRVDDFVGHPNPDHDETMPLEVLSLLIDDLKEHARNDLEAGNPKRAEANLVEVINHAEERESRHGMLFKERVEIQEMLALIYQKQKKWAEARKILHVLLQEGGESRPELATEQEWQRSRQYHMLATVHLAMYQAHPSDGNPQEAPHLQAASRFANLAVNKNCKLRGVNFGSQDPNLLESVQTLITILETQGRTVLAESYYRKFMANRTTANPSAEALLRSLSTAPSSDFDVIEIDDLFISAIRTGDQNQIQGLLSTADVNCRCNQGKTPLMHSTELEDEITIRKLLDHGAEINATADSGGTALHQAVIKNNVRMARLLLDLDADIEAKDKNLATPLVKAVEKNHGLLVSYLLSQGANTHVKDRAGWTLLHHAAHNGAVDVLKHLLYPSHEVDVNATCPAGKTALHYCAELTLIEPAKTLLGHNADVDALDANSRSPLFFAVNKPCNEKREQFVTLLLKNGAQIDAARLPTRRRDYPALQNYPSNVISTVPSSIRRCESTSTIATSRTSRSSWLRRISFGSRQA